jgi:uncharacterized membrane protein
MPKWLVYSILANIVWGIWSIIPKEKSADLSDELMQVICTAGLVPTSLLFLASKNVWQGKRHLKGCGFALLTGLCGGLGNYLILRALALGGEASALFPLTGIFPLITLVLAITLLRERPNRVQLLGVFLALGAVALFSGADGFDRGMLRNLAEPWMATSLAALGLFGLSGISQKIATNYISVELSTICFALAFVPVA